LFWDNNLKLNTGQGMTNIFFKFWRIGSIVLLTVVLLFCYTSLPENIAVGFEDEGNPKDFINKQQFFYWSAGIIMGINFLLGVFENLIVKVNFSKILRGTGWAERPQAASSFFKGWVSAFLAFVNTYLVFVLLGLYNINSSREQKLDFNYNYLLLLGVLVLLILLIFPFYRFLATKAPHED
jgi:uncharacterized membrane protein